MKVGNALSGDSMGSMGSIEDNTLMSLETYGAYRLLAREKGYCEPWVPHVGKHYGTGAFPKFMYCGGAAWFDYRYDFPADDAAAKEMAAALTQKFIDDGAYSTPFWRLFWRAAHLFPEAASMSDEDLLHHVAWTNLSKTGLLGQPAPPHNDLALRALDVKQMQAELAMLEPDILLCVSGSLVPATGDALFRSYEKIADFAPSTDSTWFRRAPWGGYLMWTMHPGYKSENWRRSVLGDLSILIALLNDPQEAARLSHALERSSTCTRIERAVLDNIAAWPDVPATATYHSNGNWSVETPSEHAEAYPRPINEGPEAG
jgi:hypothetical protein